jgi:hypothetical protein
LTSNEYRIYLDKQSVLFKDKYSISEITNGSLKQNLWAMDIRTKLLIEFEKNQKDLSSVFVKRLTTYIIFIDNAKWWIHYNLKEIDFLKLLQDHSEIDDTVLYQFSDVLKKSTDKINTSSVKTGVCEIVENNLNVIINDDDFEKIIILCDKSIKLLHCLNSAIVEPYCFIINKTGYECIINKQNVDRQGILENITSKLMRAMFFVSLIQSSNNVINHDGYLYVKDGELYCSVKSPALYKTLSRYCYREMKIINSNLQEIRNVWKKYDLCVTDEAYGYVELNLKPDCVKND